MKAECTQDMCSERIRLTNPWTLFVDMLERDQARWNGL